MLYQGKVAISCIRANWHYVVSWERGHMLHHVKRALSGEGVICCIKAKGHYTIRGKGSCIGQRGFILYQGKMAYCIIRAKETFCKRTECHLLYKGKKTLYKTPPSDWGLKIHHPQMGNVVKTH